MGHRCSSANRPGSQQSPKPPKFLDPIKKNESADAAKPTVETNLTDLSSISLGVGSQEARPTSGSATPHSKFPSQDVIECPQHIERILKEWESPPETSFQHNDGVSSPRTASTPSSASTKRTAKQFWSKAARDIAAQRHFILAAQKEAAKLEHHYKEAEKLLHNSAGMDFMDVLRDTMATSKLSAKWHDNLYGRYSPVRPRPLLISAAPFATTDSPAGDQAQAGTSGGLREPLERGNSERAQLPPVLPLAKEDTTKRRVSFKAPKEHSLQIRAKLLRGKLDYTQLFESQKKEQEGFKESEEKYKALLNEHFLKEEAAWKNLGLLTGIPELADRRQKTPPAVNLSGL
jgi:hypothetical protein